MSSPGFYNLNDVYPSFINATFSKDRYYVTNVLTQNLLVVFQYAFQRINIDNQSGIYYRGRLTNNFAVDLNLAVTALGSYYYIEENVCSSAKLYYICPRGEYNYSKCFNVLTYIPLISNHLGTLLKVRFQVTANQVKILEVYNSSQIYMIERSHSSILNFLLHQNSDGFPFDIILELSGENENSTLPNTVSPGDNLYKRLKRNIHLAVKSCSVTETYISVNDNLCELITTSNNYNLIIPGGVPKYFTNLPVHNRVISNRREIAIVFSALFNVSRNIDKRYDEIKLFDTDTVNVLCQLMPQLLDYQLDYTIETNYSQNSATEIFELLRYDTNEISTTKLTGIQQIEVHQEGKELQTIFSIRKIVINKKVKVVLLNYKHKYNAEQPMPDQHPFIVTRNGENIIKKTLQICY